MEITSPTSARIPIKLKRVLIPKISVMAPENNTGNIVTIVTRNHKFPKTRPLSHKGVSFCKKVSAGMSIPTKENPDNRIKIGVAVSLKPSGR